MIEISEYRTQLYEYLQNRMMAIAPNVTVMVGELVGARLIAHAGDDFNIICMGFPPKNLENLKNSTLEKEGLYPNSLLQIEEK